MIRAMILSGAGRYADPWHAFADTSSRLAGLLEGEGLTVEVRDDVDDALSGALDDVDLLVINLGDPGLTGPEPDSAVQAAAGLHRYIERGGPVLALHTSASTFPKNPEWEAILGGRWVRKLSMHPEFGHSRVQVYPERHTIVSGTHDFMVDDELYSYLRLGRDITILAAHDYEGVEHPLVWVRQHGAARVVYDALGHDTRSYESPEHRALLAKAAHWLVDDGRMNA